MSRFACALVALAVLVIGCGQSASTPPAATPTPSPRTALTADEQAQLAQLEARPLKPPGAGSPCPDGPHTSSIKPYANGYLEGNLYGTGPVYGQGGPSSHGTNNVYFDVTYFTDPTVKGVVLVRIQDLNSAYRAVFLAPYGHGPVIGTDTINGDSVNLYGELVLLAASPPAGTNAAPGWGIWKLRQGIDKRFQCAWFQIDTAAGSENFTAPA